MYTSFGTNFPYIEKNLLAAKKRGVDIKIIFNKRTYDEKDDNGNYKYTRYREGIKRLFNSGMEIKFIDTQKLFYKDYSTIHSKMIIVDDRFLIVGSNNWTKSAVLENREIAIFTSYSNIVADAIKLFNKDWKFAK